MQRVPLKKKNWHIGWNNNLEKVNNFYEKLEEDYFYFNHSFKYKGNKKNILSNTKFNNSFSLFWQIILKKVKLNKGMIEIYR